MNAASYRLYRWAVDWVVENVLFLLLRRKRHIFRKYFRKGKVAHYKYKMEQRRLVVGHQRSITKVCLVC